MLESLVALLTDPRFMWGWMGLAGISLIVGLRITAPYGRHQRRGWGPFVSARWAWVLMEFTVLFVFASVFVDSGRRDSVSWVFFALFGLHYVHRSLIYPFLARNQGRTMPLSILVMGIVFNVVNGGINGGGLFVLGPPHEMGWLGDVRFVVGAGLMVVGACINIRSDAILRGLGRGTEQGYQIPHGFLYRWISCPTYLGEILEWTGWAIATWSLAGTSFAVWTIAVLTPRALSHHRWYRSQFPDYPPHRRALIPFVL